MEIMQSLMVDMDDVIVDSLGFLYLVNEYLGTHYTYDDMSGYYIQDLIPEELVQDFFDNFFAEKNVYDYCNINPYAFEGLKELNEVYKLCIGTAYQIPRSNKASAALLQHKYFFLLKYFPFLTPKHFSFTNDKSFIKTDIKMDDLLHNLDGAKRKILFTAFHNKKIILPSDVERVDDWLDVKRLLLTPKN